MSGLDGARALPPLADAAETVDFDESGRRMRRVPPPLEMQFRLCAARETLEMTPAELATATGGGVSPDVIVAIELGDCREVTVKNLVALARALDVLPHELCEDLEPFYL